MASTTSAYMGLWREISLFLWKFYLTRKRNRKDTIKELLVPALLLLLIYFLSANNLDRSSLIFISALYAPMCFSQYARWFLVNSVSEKQDRIKETLKMMGVSNLGYVLGWTLAEALVGLIIALEITVLFVVFGLVTEASHIGLCFALFLCYSLSALMYAFCIAAFFSTPRLAGELGGLIYIAPGALYYVTTLLNADPWAVYLTFIFPQNPLMYGVAYLLGGTIPVPFEATVLFTVLDMCIYGCLSIYLDQVVPNQYGISKPLYFPITALISAFRRPEAPQQQEELRISYTVLRDLGPSAALSDDSEAQSFTFSLQSLSKSYGNIDALKRFSLQFQESQICW